MKESRELVILERRKGNDKKASAATHARMEIRKRGRNDQFFECKLGAVKKLMKISKRVQVGEEWSGRKERPYSYLCSQSKRKELAEGGIVQKKKKVNNQIPLRLSTGEGLSSAEVGMSGKTTNQRNQERE